MVSTGAETTALSSRMWSFLGYLCVHAWAAEGCRLSLVSSGRQWSRYLNTFFHWVCSVLLYAASAPLLSPLLLFISMSFCVSVGIAESNIPRTVFPRRLRCW